MFARAKGGGVPNPAPAGYTRRERGTKDGGYFYDVDGSGRGETLTPAEQARRAEELERQARAEERMKLEQRKRAQKAGGGTGSTANQLATRYAAAPGAGTALPVVAPRGDEMFELNAKRAPIQAPLIQPEDPRVLLQPGGQPLYADGE